MSQIRSLQTVGHDLNKDRETNSKQKISLMGKMQSKLLFGTQFKAKVFKPFNKLQLDTPDLVY